MTEKEKMLKGYLYNANYDEELINERKKAKDLCFEYNNLRPSDTAGQKTIISKLLGKIKGEFYIKCTPCQRQFKKRL